MERPKSAAAALYGRTVEELAHGRAALADGMPSGVIPGSQRPVRKTEPVLSPIELAEREKVRRSATSPKLAGAVASPTRKSAHGAPRNNAGKRLKRLKPSEALKSGSPKGEAERPSTSAWSRPKREVVRPGLTKATKELLCFDPEPVEALSQIALREKPLALPVPTSPTKRTGQHKPHSGDPSVGAQVIVDSDGQTPEQASEIEAKEEPARPRFSAMSVNNSRRSFKNKLRDDMASSLVRMSKIHSGLIFTAEQKEKELAKLCSEMDDLLTLAGTANTSPVVGVDADVVMRRAKLGEQVDEIRAKIKDAQTETKDLTKTLRDDRDERLLYRAMLNEREEELEHLASERADLVKLLAQLTDLAKRTRHKYAADHHAYTYEKESREHKLLERRIDLKLRQEKAAMEAKLEAGLKRWEEDLEQGPQITHSPSFHVHSKQLASQVEAYLSYDVLSDSRFEAAEEEPRPRSPGQISTGAKAPDAATARKGLPKGAKRVMARHFLTILQGTRARQGFKSCLLNSKLFLTIMHYAICKGSGPDDLDAALTTAPEFIAMLRQSQSYTAELERKRAAHSCVLKSLQDSLEDRRETFWKQRAAAADATVSDVRHRLLSLVATIVPGAPSAFVDDDVLNLLAFTSRAVGLASEMLPQLTARRNVAAETVAEVLDCAIARCVERWSSSEQLGETIAIHLPGMGPVHDEATEGEESGSGEVINVSATSDEPGTDESTSGITQLETLGSEALALQAGSSAKGSSTESEACLVDSAKEPSPQIAEDAAREPSQVAEGSPKSPSLVGTAESKDETAETDAGATDKEPSQPTESAPSFGAAIEDEEPDPAKVATSEIDPGATDKEPSQRTESAPSFGVANEDEEPNPTKEAAAEEAKAVDHPAPEAVLRETLDSFVRPLAEQIVRNAVEDAVCAVTQWLQTQREAA